MMVTPSVKLVRPLGEGGMGAVWVADHLALRTQVVVKFIASGLKSSKEAQDRFSREAAAASQVKSPHVVQTFDHGVTALDLAGIGIDDVDLFEINEAFAAQVLGCIRAFADDDYGKQLGRDGAIGAVDPDRVNVNGGAIALGHPIAASGARLVLTLAHELRRRSARYGVATLCVGGGQGQAIVLEAA
jgi:hypothetical protein